MKKMNTRQLSVCLVGILSLLVTFTVSLPVPETGNYEAEIQQMPKVLSTEEELVNIANTDKAATAMKSVAVPAVASQSDNTDQHSAVINPVEVKDDSVASAEDVVLPRLSSSSSSSLSTDDEEEQGQEPQESYFYPPQESYSREEDVGLPAVDLSPRAVAEYLFLSGDIRGFEQAVADLLADGLLSEEDVESYKEAVGLEYEAMLKNVMEEEEDYLQESERQNALYNSLPGLSAPETDVYQLPALMDYADVGSDAQMKEVENELEEEDSLTQLLETLLDYYEEGQDQGYRGNSYPLADIPGVDGDYLTQAAKDTVPNEVSIEEGKPHEGMETTVDGAEEAELADLPKSSKNDKNAEALPSDKEKESNSHENTIAEASA